MSEGKSNSGLLAVIAVVLIAILGIAVYQMNDKTPGEEVADSISDAADSIGDAANDAAN